jgi:hypothetical protein
LKEGALPKDVRSVRDYRFLANPIDVIEEMIVSQEWPYHRPDSEAIIIEIPGRWGDYRMEFVWQQEVGLLQITCVFDIPLNSKNQATLYELLNGVNGQTIIGHFERSSEENTLNFRYSVFFGDARLINGEQMEEIVELVFDESERFYPVFQMTLLEGKSQKEALSIALLETVGEA